MSGSHLARTGLVLLSLGVFASPLQAVPASPFLAMAGSWTGGGTLTTSDGMQERLRCRATYNVAGAGEQLRLSLKCASQSYTFDLAGEIQYQGGAISGAWTESNRNASGTITGRGAGDHVEAAARGNNFSANLSLTTRGSRQSVSIRPQASNVTAVTLALERR
ncbi:hypothetical protein ACFFWD_09180 [Bradyrhizobium erythrophlei]|uniref:hypothetical protein n=1 Tax=Bradyrhizobium erythrophlei TaxID=1437360 RepID=UPI0035EB55F4